MYKLRELEERDIQIINKWRNDPDLIAELGAPFRYININVDRNWFAAYMNNRNSQVRCAVVDEKDEILGLVSLVSIDHLNGSAEFHIMIGDKANQGKGIGTFAVNAMLQHAFLNLHLHRVELTVVEQNDRAHKLYEKCGFVKEGTKRLSKFKNGKYVSMDIYSILKDEYQNICSGGDTD